ncbi:glycosyltransferase family 52, partial [Ursidibacter arcticus]
EFQNIFTDKSKKFNFTFHLNLSHSWKLFTPLLQIMNSHQDRVLSVKVHLYDDGSEGAINLYKLRKSKIDINPKILEVREITNIHQLNALDNEIKVYLWDLFYDAEYHFLEIKELFSDELKPLLEMIPYHHKIDLNRFSKLSEEDRNIYLKVINISSDMIKLIEELKSDNVFLFTGTTVFNNTESVQETVKNIHIKAINNYINSQGKYFIGENFKLVIKGHPNSSYVNNGLRQHFPNEIHLPEDIPYEILSILGLKPNKMGGFASTSYFNYPKENIADLIFLTDLNTDFSSDIDIEFDLFKSQKNLMETMISLNIVDRENTHSYVELFDN